MRLGRFKHRVKRLHDREAVTDAKIHFEIESVTSSKPSLKSSHSIGGNAFDRGTLTGNVNTFCFFSFFSGGRPIADVALQLTFS
tara:strand:+ start:14 stop:265 length:252 start_codon:yes stop_codon:yes gene_type:complete